MIVSPFYCLACLFTFRKANITSFQISGLQPSIVFSQSALVSVPYLYAFIDKSMVTHDFNQNHIAIVNLSIVQQAVE